MKKLYGSILSIVLAITIIFSGTACTRTVNPFFEIEESDVETSEDEKGSEAGSDSDGAGEEGTTDKFTEELTKEPTKDSDEDVTKPSDEEPTKETDEKPTKDSDKEPTKELIDDSTEAPTETPTVKPTEAPTVKPTETPTVKPTEVPTEAPTVKPTETPTSAPTEAPTEAPTTAPSGGSTTAWQPGSNSYTYSELSSCSNVTTSDIANARAILSSIIYNEMSDLEKIRTIHDYLVKNTTYDSNYYSRSDSHDHLKNILVNKVGVCQGYSVAFYVFMKELGINCTLMLGEADNGTGSVGHAWNAVEIDGYWYFVDVTWDDPFINGSTSYMDGYNLSYEYLLCTFDHIGVTHTYDSYIGEQPDVYGSSTQYNDQMYMSMGLDGVYRISSLDKVAEVAQSVTNTCTYLFIIDGGTITTDDVWSAFCNNIKIGCSLDASMSGSTIKITVTKS